MADRLACTNLSVAADHHGDPVCRAEALFDVMGRILGARMSEILGQQVIIENTTGAAGIIGVNRVVNAATGRLYVAVRQHRHACL